MIKFKLRIFSPINSLGKQPSSTKTVHMDVILRNVHIMERPSQQRFRQKLGGECTCCSPHSKYSHHPFSAANTHTFFSAAGCEEKEAFSLPKKHVFAARQVIAHANSQSFEGYLLLETSNWRALSTLPASFRECGQLSARAQVETVYWVAHELCALFRVKNTLERTLPF